MMLFPATLLLSLAAYGAKGSSTFGTAVCGAGDVNGDGVPDVLVSDGGPAGGAFQCREYGEHGRVWMLSGVDASVLWSVTSADVDDGFGRALAVCADLNEDGVREVLVGTNDLRPEQRGFVSVRCGASGAELSVFRGPDAEFTFGRELHTIGDLDGDGLDEVAIRSHSTAERDDSRFSIVSTADGSIAWVVSSPDLLRFGCAGDVTGDGVPDLVFVRRGIGKDRAARLYDGASRELVWETRVCDGLSATLGLSGDGHVRGILVSLTTGLVLLSAKDGSIIESSSFESDQAMYGRIASFADLDDDGVGDLLWTQPGAGIAWGRIVAVSGKSTKPIYEVGPGEVSAWRFGYSLDFVGDLDGDGVDDFVVGEDPMRAAAHVCLFSGAAGRLLFVLGRDADGVRVVPERGAQKAR